MHTYKHIKNTNQIYKIQHIQLVHIQLVQDTIYYTSYNTIQQIISYYKIYNINIETQLSKIRVIQNFTIRQ